MRLARILPFTIFVIAALLLTASAEAESIQWNTTAANTTLCTTRTPSDKISRGRICDFFIENPHFSITYNVRAASVAENGAEIASLACGATVPQGTRIKFEIVPHSFQDVYWLATGGAMDDPNGEWIANAAGPTPIACYAKDYLGRFHQEDDRNPEHLYLPFVVAPPVKDIATSPGLTCAGSMPKVCVASEAGAQSATYSFSSTIGKFYARATFDSPSAVARNPQACAREDASNNYPLVVLREDEVRVLHRGGVEDATDFSEEMQDMRRYDELLNRTFVLDVPAQSLACPITVVAGPENPETHAPAAPTLTSGGACTPGTPHTINFVSADPDGDNLRYGIDWDADGSVDQWAPPSGYVASAKSQAASRTYSIAGSKTVKVMAQDEGGLSSDWATISFTCAPPAVAGFEGEGEGTADGGGGALPPPAADLDLRVVPSLVRQGDTTHVNWSAQNVQSCTVIAPNGDSWSGLVSPIGGRTSSPITTQTVYTLSCIDLDGLPQSKQATVRILPTFQEL
jgi:hypothetical protein